jgi:RNA polymerase sigma-70 factor (ECF subfamily)
VSEIESTWLKQAVKGDAEAFSHLVETYQEPVYHLCYRMLGEPGEAEDAAQETFLRAFQGLRRYDSQRPFSTWLLSIAAHYCIDQIRRRRLTVLSYDDMPILDPPDSAPGPENSLIICEDQRRVQALLERLDARDRAAIVMLYWYEFSYEEIAGALSMSVSAVKSRLHRARLELVELWGKRPPLTIERERTCHESPAF